MSVRIERRPLYELVWEQPVSKVAKLYGISSVALAKICRKLQVPIPGRGYWQRIQNDQRTEKPVLRPRTDGGEEFVILRPRPRSFLPELSGLPVASSLAEPVGIHPLVALTLQARASSAPKYGIGPARLNLSVSDDVFPRAIRLYNLLLMKLEARGFGVEAVVESRGHNMERAYVTHVVATRWRFGLALWEVRRSAGDDPLLLFRLSDVGMKDKEIERWQESKARRMVDAHLDLVVERIAGRVLANIREEYIQKEAADERARQDAVKHEEARLRQLERAKAKRIVSQCEAWILAEEVREYSTRLEAAPMPKGEGLAAWIAWARLYADSIDPLKSVAAWLHDGDISAGQEAPQYPVARFDPPPSEYSFYRRRNRWGRG